MLELIARKALARPGMVQLMLAAFEPASEEPGTESIQAAGYRLVDALDHPLSSPVERLRVVLALRLIASAAHDPAPPGRQRTSTSTATSWCRCWSSWRRW